MVAAIGISLFAVASVREQSMQVDLLETDVRELEGRLEDFRLSDQSARRPPEDLRGKAAREGAGDRAARGPRAQERLHGQDRRRPRRGLRRVDAGSQLYVVTAAHVVSEVGQQVPARAQHGLVARRGGRDATGTATSQCSVSTASPSVRSRSGRSPRANKPRVGDALLLIGSPYGLGGTVTSGVVSRVQPKEIQTDAAANPGNSGGPAVDRKGHVVGVLVAGGGENLNFAVPISRLCGSLRRC